MTPVSAPPQTSVRVSVNVPWDAPRSSPYVRRLYTELLDLGVEVQSVNDEHGPPDILHMHWPEACLGDRSMVRSLRAAVRTLAGCVRRRARGARLVWTVHNLQHHEHLHPLLERIFWAVFTRLVDGAIHLSEPARASALDRHPHLRRRYNVVIPHGHFIDDYPNPPSRADARARDGIAVDANVTLFFGQIRPYKNVIELIDTFSQVDDPGAVLIIAGPPTDAAYAERVAAAAMADPRIRLRLRFIDDSEVPWLFAACDRVALPFRCVLNSGSVMLGLSMSRPVLIPDLDEMGGFAEAIGTSWLVQYRPPITSNELVGNLRPRALPQLAAFAWPGIATHTITTYERFANSTTVGRSFP